MRVVFYSFPFFECISHDEPPPPGWKVFLAILSLLLTILIWQRGLQESFNRPSVNPKLALNQREMALLSSPSLPEEVRPILVGEDPRLELKKTLLELDKGQIANREKLLLATLEVSNDKSRALLDTEFKESDLESVRQSLVKKLEGQGNSQELLENIQVIQNDPLIYRLSCLAISEAPDICIDQEVSSAMAFRLLFSQLVPLGATLIGIVLLIREAWVYIRKVNLPFPELSSLPLSNIDMILLVAGGFVVLGELVTPLAAMPISELFFRETPSPLKESLKVFVGYGAMTLPPLLILRQQIRSIQTKTIRGDWFQWGWRFLPTSALQAFKGWFMVVPFVLLASWLTNLFLGDPGGSNPLLEMVLSSKNFWSLTVLFITTVLMAPFFEELIFRGTLLPVLVSKQGRTTSVIVSALIFALAHLSVSETPPLFVLGIGLALLRLASGRLLPCVIMHSLWNGITFVNLLILGT